MNLWLSRIDNRTRHYLTGILQITIHLLRPQQHELGGVVEMIWFLRILGQVVRQLEPESNQVPDRVFILEIGQSPDLRSNDFFPSLLHHLPQFRLDPLGHRCHFSFGGPVHRFFRRHLSCFQDVEDQLPTLQIPFSSQVTIYIMQSDLTLGLLRPVTLDAVRLKKRRCYRIKARPFLRRCVKLQGAAQQGD